MSDTPKKFPIPQIERAIHESLNPKGMSTHSGKVTLDVSWVQRLLILADHMSELERELAEAIAKERERCALVCEEFYSVENIAQKCAAAIRKGE